MENQPVDIEGFVASAIAQVMRGVEASQDVADGAGGTVNPVSKRNTTWGQRTHLRTYRKITPIEFDLAVTATSASSVEGGGKLAIAGIGAGGAGSKGSSNEVVSRVKFTVEVMLPAFSPQLQPGDEE